VINAMREAYGLGTYVNTGITHVENFTTEEGTTALHAVAAVPMKLSREGNMLRSDADISLFDLNGNLVRNVTGTGRCEMSLEGLRQGVYHARSGSSTLRVQVR